MPFSMLGAVNMGGGFEAMNWCGNKRVFIGTEHCPLKHNFRDAVINNVIAPDDQLIWCKKHCPTGALNCEEHEIYCLYIQNMARESELDEGARFREFITNGGNLDAWRELLMESKP